MANNLDGFNFFVYSNLRFGIDWQNCCSVLFIFASPHWSNVGHHIIVAASQKTSGHSSPPRLCPLQSFSSPTDGYTEKSHALQSARLLWEVACTAHDMRCVPLPAKWTQLLCRISQWPAELLQTGRQIDTSGDMLVWRRPVRKGCSRKLLLLILMFLRLNWKCKLSV